MLARQAYAAAQADRQLRLAKLRRTRSYREWACGELACYWREGGGRSKRDRVKVSKGCYCGPAVVISQVHRRVGDQAVPRNVVLLLHRGELILATPSQLRSASETEKAMFQIDGVAGNLTPDFLEKGEKGSEAVPGPDGIVSTTRRRRARSRARVGKRRSSNGRFGDTSSRESGQLPRHVRGNTNARGRATDRTSSHRCRRPGG